MIKTFNEDKIGCKGIENKSFKHWFIEQGDFFFYTYSHPLLDLLSTVLEDRDPNLLTP